MTRNEYIGYFFTALILTTLGALVVQYAVRWTARFKPRYSRALVSSVVALAISVGISTGLHEFTPEIYPNSAVRVFIAFVVLAGCHRYFLRSEAGDLLPVRKAFLVALCEMVGALVGLFVVLLVLGAVKRLFV